MKIIGLTGGIGSGKSFVADVATKYFQVRHINTDEIARMQMLKGGVSFDGVVKEFSKYSDKLLDENGEIDRKVLGSIVLSDQNLVERLDELTHPAVIDEIMDIIAFEREKAALYINGSNDNTGDNSENRCGNVAVMIETALIYEAGIDKICDEVWYVYAPMATRRKRLALSRGYSDEKIEGFFDRQKSEEEFLRRADRTVPNGNDVSEDDMVRIISSYL